MKIRTQMPLMHADYPDFIFLICADPFFLNFLRSKFISKQPNGRQTSANTDGNKHTDSHGLRTQIFFECFIRVFLCSSVFSLFSKQVLI